MDGKQSTNQPAEGPKKRGERQQQWTRILKCYWKIKQNLDMTNWVIPICTYSCLMILVLIPVLAKKEIGVHLRRIKCAKYLRKYVYVTPIHITCGYQSKFTCGILESIVG